MQTTIIGQKCLIINPETKKMLVMQRSDYKKDAGKRDMVGGSVDFGEEVTHAIQRESLEEVGIVLEEVHTLHVTSRLFADSTQRFFVFVLWVCEKRYIEHTEIVLSIEHTTYKRVDLDELCSLDLRDTVAHALPQIKKYFT